MTDGMFTQGARLEIVVGPVQGRVTFQVWADYETQEGNEVRRMVLHASLSPREAKRLAICIRELANGNIGDFEEAGLEFEADEWGYAVVTPSRRGVWFEDETVLRDLAERLTRSAREAGE